MSVVIAAKYKDGIALAADKQSTKATTKKDTAIKINKFKYSNTGIGVVGLLRDCNLMRTLDEIVPYKDILDNVNIDDLYVIKTIIPVIFNHLSQNKRLTNNSEVYSMDSVMLYVTPERIFEIGVDLAASEWNESYAVIGCGDEKVIGYMTSIGDTSHYSKEDITKLLHNAITKACETDAFIDDSMDILYFEHENDIVFRNSIRYATKGFKIIE